MIIQSIRIEGFRCYADPVQINGFRPGLNVLHADNGGGKTTLSVALRRAVFDSHRASGKQIDGESPWGRSVSAGISLWFQHGGHDYRAWKKFGAKSARESKLQRRDAGAKEYTTIAEGDEADRMLQEMWLADDSGARTRGIRGDDRIGLAQILWTSDQGALEIDDVHAKVLDVLRDRLSEQIQRDDTGIESKVSQEVDRLVTTRGAWRKHSTLDVAERRLGELRKLREQVAAQLAEAETLVAGVTDLTADESDKLAEKRDVERELRATEEVARGREKLKAELGEARADLEAARLAHDIAKRDTERVRRLEELIAGLRRDLQSAEAALATANAELDECQVAQECCGKDLSTAEDAAADVDARADDVSDARRLAELRRELADLDDRLAQLSAIDQQRAEVQAELGGHTAPDDIELRKIRQAHSDLAVARAAAEAVVVDLDVTPEREGVVESADGPIEMSAGKTSHFRGTPSVELDWQSVGRIRASVSGDVVEERQRHLADAHQTLARQTDPFGTDDLDELERRHELARQLDRLDDEAGQQLAGATATDELTTARADFVAQIEKLLAGHADWRDNEPDPAELEQRLNQQRRRADDRSRAARLAYDRATREVATAERKADQCATRAEVTRRQLNQHAQELEELLAVAPSDRRSSNELEAHRRLRTALDRVSKLEAELESHAPGSSNKVDRLRTKLTALEAAVANATTQLAETRGRLQQLQAASPYTRMAEYEEEIAQLDDARAREERHVRGLQLLQRTIEQCRDELRDSLCKPLESAIRNSLQRLGWSVNGAVELDDSLLPAGIRLADYPQRDVNVAELSTGEQALLWLAVRIELARQLCADGPRLLLLDDPLTTIDAPHMQRAMDLLHDAARQMQVLILTCHPDRYAATNANFIDLTAARQTAVVA